MLTSKLWFILWQYKIIHMFTEMNAKMTDCGCSTVDFCNSIYNTKPSQSPIGNTAGVGIICLLIKSKNTHNTFLPLYLLKICTEIACSVLYTRILYLLRISWLLIDSFIVYYMTLFYLQRSHSVKWDEMIMNGGYVKCLEWRGYDLSRHCSKLLRR